MAKLDNYINEICEITKDYRALEGIAPNPERVSQWLGQFPVGVRTPMAKELAHVLSKTYYSQQRVSEFVDSVLESEELTGKDKCTFWKKCGILAIQGGGNSQNTMLKLFDDRLRESCNFGIVDCSNTSGQYVYIDDFLFSGGRIRQDLLGWIQNSASDKCTVHVITIALYEYGRFNVEKQLLAKCKELGKEIRFQWWRTAQLEDRLYVIAEADALRPTSLPDDPRVVEYVKSLGQEQKYRPAGKPSKNTLFSSEEGRSLLEQQFLVAGCHIRTICPNLDQYNRPLGRSMFKSMGFGALQVSYRNCPNNAPLALWVGDPWVPLFPRTTNADTEVAKFVAHFKGQSR